MMLPSEMKKIISTKNLLEEAWLTLKCPMISKHGFQIMLKQQNAYEHPQQQNTQQVLDEDY